MQRYNLKARIIVAIKKKLNSPDETYDLEKSSVSFSLVENKVEFTLKTNNARTFEDFQELSVIFNTKLINFSTYACKECGCESCGSGLESDLQIHIYMALSDLGV